MLLVPFLFWHEGGKDREVQWQCVSKAYAGDATVCIWFELTSQVKCPQMSKSLIPTAGQVAAVI